VPDLVETGNRDSAEEMGEQPAFGTCNASEPGQNACGPTNYDCLLLPAGWEQEAGTAREKQEKLVSNGELECERLFAKMNLTAAT
jgi:hypothetical protein